MYICIYVYIYVCVCVFIYIYIYIVCVCVCVCVCGVPVYLRFCSCARNAATFPAFWFAEASLLVSRALMIILSGVFFLPPH